MGADIIPKIYGKLQNMHGNSVTLQLSQALNAQRISKLANGKQPIFELRIDDGRRITNAQRRMCYALMKDVAIWSGINGNESKQWMKFYYMAETGMPYFSLSDTDLDNARNFIDYIMHFCFKWGIPFKYSTYCALRGDYYFQRQCILHRKCLICSARSQIDHWDHTVGMGRSRKKLDNRQFGFTSLCAKHHHERHAIGKKEFENKYHINIIPIHLNHDEIKILNIGG